MGREFSRWLTVHHVVTIDGEVTWIVLVILLFRTTSALNQKFVALVSPVSLRSCVAEPWTELLLRTAVRTPCYETKQTETNATNF
ncbi:hypothetical protein Poly30_51780 [Planctomycetes bacterium Poly30]|uniref:Uncharacterized protein n=1 Tax=Saltatorellus ferox TaxID=2528018 RepID=A0A518EZV8_9BACT|nr:hypothetical protein Poly30_51780 [Planctomycetes bacterium Poly30]